MMIDIATDRSPIVQPDDLAETQPPSPWDGDAIVLDSMKAHAPDAPSGHACPDDLDEPDIETILASLQGRSPAFRKALIQALADGDAKNASDPASWNRSGRTNPPPSSQNQCWRGDFGERRSRSG